MWHVNNSGIASLGEPIPINFSIPAGYSQTESGGPILVSPSRVSFKVSPPLVIPKNCNCVLTSASFCFSQPNVAPANTIASISAGNNRISINFDNAGLTDYRIPLGLYSVTDVQLALNQIARDEGWVTSSTNLFILTGISATQQVVFSLNPAALTGGVFPTNGIEISFTNPGVDTLNDSMGELLGFPTTGPGSSFTVLGGGSDVFSEVGPDPADFANISAYNLYVSFLKNSYQNGAIGQLLYSFPIGPYTPNSVVNYQPSLMFPVQVQPNEYTDVEIWTTDQSGNPLPWVYYQSPFSFSGIIAKNKADGSF